MKHKNAYKNEHKNNHNNNHKSDYRHSQKIMKRIIWVLCVLLVLSGAGLAVVAAAPQSGDSPSLELYKKQPTDNEAFHVSNMVPGDKESQNFTVRIYHNDPLRLYFKTSITGQTKDLGEVLKIRVTDITDPASEKLICQGPFNEVNNLEYFQDIAKGSGHTDVTYKVDTWLETSVGNAYQAASLDADFQWYVKDDGGTDPTKPTEPTGPTGPSDKPSQPTQPGGSGGGSGSGSSGGGLTAKTGDTASLVLWSIFAVCALAIIILLLKSRKDKKSAAIAAATAAAAGGYTGDGAGAEFAGAEFTDATGTDDDDSETRKKLRRSMFIAILLALMLAITTFALITAMVDVKDNHFETGVVKINLNDGQPVISENEYLFEPGMRVKKDFFIKNEGGIDAYYKIYLEDVKGDLADVLQVTIREKKTDGTDGKVLYKGLPSDLTRGSAAVAEDTLTAGQKKDLTILFYFPKERGNEAQDKTLSFQMGATATQVRNNPGKEF